MVCLPIGLVADVAVVAENCGPRRVGSRGRQVSMVVVCGVDRQDLQGHLLVVMMHPCVTKAATEGLRSAPS